MNVRARADTHARTHARARVLMIAPTSKMLPHLRSLLQLMESIRAFYSTNILYAGAINDTFTLVQCSSSYLDGIFTEILFKWCVFECCDHPSKMKIHEVRVTRIR